MNIKMVYLMLAIVGAVIPYFFFIQHVEATGFGPTEFVTAVFANSPASGFTSDLLISSMVFWMAMFHKRRQGNGPHPGPYVLLNLLIGLSCALPAYLYATVKDD